MFLKNVFVHHIQNSPRSIYKIWSLHSWKMPVQLAQSWGRHAESPSQTAREFFFFLNGSHGKALAENPLLGS